MDIVEELLAILGDIERIEGESRESIARFQAEMMVHIDGLRERIEAVRIEGERSKRMNEIIVTALMGSLTVKQKRVIMYMIAGLNERKISSKVKITISAVRVIQKRIKHKFKVDQFWELIDVFSRLIDRM